jgi:chemotaxis protein histidine kinase CheA
MPEIPAPATTTSKAPPAAADESDDDFNDLEKLLEDPKDGGRQGEANIGPSALNRSRRNARAGGFGDQTMRVPIKQLDNLSNLMGELVVNRNSLEQDQERMRQFLDNLLHQVTLLSDVSQRTQDFYERSLLEIALLANRQGHRSAWRSEDSAHTRESAWRPEEMDRFTPFHSLAQEIIELIVRVRESAADIEFLVDEADQVTRQLRQVTTQLQEGLTRARMKPFAETTDRLFRAVREIAIKCGKQAQLQVEGKDILIDKMIVDQLYDPMTHLVNNAITHGIEAPEVRLAAGKPAVGRITIRAFHQGNQTVVSVSDDGAGIDPQKVKAKAIKQGLLTAAQAQRMSRSEVYDLLFMPGFSTQEQATEYAGRGVGMNVVQTSLQEIRGTVSIDSTIGKGTVFTIRLPLVLSISKALTCISDRARIAFPMDGVEDMIDVPRDQVTTGADGLRCIEWRGQSLPYRPLRDLLVTTAI